MRLVLSISEKAARALRVLAAEQGHRGVSAFVESVYGGDPPVAVHKASMLAAVMEQIAAQGPGKMTEIPPEVAAKYRGYTEDDHAKSWANIRRLGLVPSEQGPKEPPFVPYTRQMTDEQIEELVRMGPVGPLVPATDCGFGPDMDAGIDHEAKRLDRLSLARAENEGMPPKRAATQEEAIAQEEGTLGEGHE